MALYVNTNVSSLNGRNKLTQVTNNLNTTYQRLSSGLRINSAKDDAAGLQISDRLTSQINGLNQGNRNASDAIAFAQVGEGALEESISMLQRIRTLTVQSLNGTNTAKDREALQAEVTQLSLEINTIADRTMYNEIPMLSGNNGPEYDPAIKGYRFQVGANAGDSLILTDLDVPATTIDMAGRAKNNGVITDADITDALKGAIFQITDPTKAGNTLKVVDAVIAEFDKQRGNFGAFQNRLESTIRNQANISMNTADARSRIRDADFAEEGANLTQQNIIQQAASSMLTQANMRPQMALSLIG